MAKLNFFFHTTVFFRTFRKNLNEYGLLQYKKVQVLIQRFVI